jgi:hypothetical protein
MSKPMILFLDFDGVLHHENVTLHKCKSPTARRYLKDHERRYLTVTGREYVKGPNLFEYADQLAACLAPYPDIQIVISSSWREHRPPSLADRVIGQTPYCDKYGGVGSRLSEILAYLDGNALASRPWIAIDDQAQLFWDDTENPPDNLYIIDNKGLTETEAIAFSQWLSTKYI